MDEMTLHLDNGSQLHFRGRLFSEAVWYDEDSGVLTHPVWGERSVFFTGLEMTQEPRENYVAYRFEFQQADENGKIPY